jgi:hypothetical protein
MKKLKKQAPAHTLDISHFRDGLPKDQELGEWIQSYQKQNPTSSDIMSFYTMIPTNPADNFD